MNRYEKYMKEKRTFRKGDIVKWTYKHHLNSKQFTLITKIGKFISKIDTKRVDGGMRWIERDYCKVHFKGNKQPSKVLIDEIEKFGMGEIKK